MVGRSFTPEMRAIVEEEFLSGLVIPQVNIDSEDLRALYSRAKAMIFPSLCEGFGWPILEAQSCGCPVLTTNRPPMTEVGGTAALYFDPADPAEAARTIAAGWGELPALSASGRANATRFNTERMMDEYVQTYRELAGA
jgi:glycosyltransferase involved in cell wall biosynthesis